MVSQEPLDDFTWTDPCMHAYVHTCIPILKKKKKNSLLKIFYILGHVHTFISPFSDQNQQDFDTFGVFCYLVFFSFTLHICGIKFACKTFHCSEIWQL